MRLKLKPILIATAAALAAGMTAGMASGENLLKAYDFAYTVTGDQRAAPIQVFDDGKKTYFQFRTTTDIPTIFVARANGQELVRYEIVPPYVEVQGTANEFVLQTGQSRKATVDYAGTHRNEIAIPSAATMDRQATAAGQVQPAPVAAAPAAAQSAAPGAASYSSILAALQAVSSAAPPAPAEDPEAPYIPQLPPGRTYAQSAPQKAAAPVRAVKVAANTVDIPFMKGSSFAGPKARSLIQHMADTSGGALVVVVGKGDADNSDIAARRADAIRNLLVSDGVDAGLITERTAEADGEPSRVSYSRIDIQGRRPTVAAAPSRPQPAGNVGYRDQPEWNTSNTPPAPPAAVQAAPGTVYSQQATSYAPPAAAGTPPKVNLPLVQNIVELVNTKQISLEVGAKLIYAMVNGKTMSDVPGAAAAPTPAPMPIWEMRVEDGTVRTALKRWADTAGWQLAWDMPLDYPINLRATFQGSFEDAAKSVAKSLERADTPIQIIFYKGNNVLRVVAKGSIKQ